MAIKEKVCKECGHITTEDKCDFCGNTILLDKFKGKIAIFDVKRSVLAEKLGIEKNGEYALKY